MKSKLLAVFFLAGSALFARPHFGVGFGVGVGPVYRPYGGYYYSAPPVVVAPPVYSAPYVAPYVAPGPYVRPFAGAVWVGPRYFGGRYYRGYWRR
jgi:hypothetical protein